MIVSYLYGEKEQLVVLEFFMGSLCCIKCPSFHQVFHLIDDWLSIDPEVLSNEEICSDMINAIRYRTKTYCALILLRNIKISFELLPVPTNDRFFLPNYMSNCLKINVSI